MSMTINFSFEVGQVVRVLRANGAGANGKVNDLYEKGKIVRAIVEMDGNVFYDVEQEFVGCMSKPCMCTDTNVYPPEELEAVS